MLEVRTIAHNSYLLRHPWPTDSRIAGSPGCGRAYVTAITPAGQVAGEGATLHAAEDAAWARYLTAIRSSPVHADVAERCVVCGLPATETWLQLGYCDMHAHQTAGATP